jgi:hypothetical protein
MDWIGTTAITIAIIFFVLGFLGNILPILPGAVLVFAGVVIHKLMLGDTSVSWTFVVVMLGAVVLTQLLDFACAWFGAKGFGATWKGGLGAVIGGIVGIFVFFPVGLLVLPIVGAVVGELLHSPDLRRAGKAGVGAVVGGVISFAAKLVVTLAMIVAFFFALPPDDLPPELRPDPAAEEAVDDLTPDAAGNGGSAGPPPSDPSGDTGSPAPPGNGSTDADAPSVPDQGAGGDSPDDDDGSGSSEDEGVDPGMTV